MITLSMLGLKLNPVSKRGYCRHGNDQVWVHIYSEPAFKVFNLVCLHTTDQQPCQAGVKVNTLRPRQNGRHFADDIFKRNFLNENIWIPIKISLKFVPKGPINNIPALVQIMAWRRSGDNPLSEPMMINLLTHICVTRPQWVHSFNPGISRERFRSPFWICGLLFAVTDSQTK